MSTNAFSAIFESFPSTGVDPITAQEIHNQARVKYDQARRRAVLGQIKALLTGKRSMPTLACRLAGRAIRGQHTCGMRTIELNRIVGTESRAGDFDEHFNPLRDQTKDRWVSIAELSMQEIGLPAVDLIQFGPEFFVRDGHHRISVAQSLGRLFIDAWVTVLEV